MQKSSSTPVSPLGVFSLAMITAGSVDSVRNLPATALFGSSLIFFFLLGALLFLLPTALVAAELASTSREQAGIYSWVGQAFGKRAGLIAVWFQWIENVIWYPTILSFVAGTVAYVINPALAQQKAFLIAIILTAFWGTTFINLLGIRSSALFGNFCALLGLLVPMTLIIALGAVWVVQGNPLKIEFTHQALLPDLGQSGLWVSLTGIMMSFCGMEIATVHASDVRDPQRSYPRAMLLTTLIILSTLICGSLAIAVVLPSEQISLVSGIMQAFDAFFSAYHLAWLLPVVAMMLIVGGMGGVNNWIIAPTRGLQLALHEAGAPALLLKTNRHGAPKSLLIGQALIVSVVSMIFLLLPTINASYWLLTALASQLYMLMYIMMFVAAVRLRAHAPASAEGFRIPGGRFGLWLVAGAGLLGSGATLVIGFIPPDNIGLGQVWHYEEMLIGGLAVLTAMPFWLIKSRKSHQAASLAANASEA